MRYSALLLILLALVGGASAREAQLKIWYAGDDFTGIDGYRLHVHVRTADDETPRTVRFSADYPMVTLHELPDKPVTARLAWIPQPPAERSALLPPPDSDGLCPSNALCGRIEIPTELTEPFMPLPIYYRMRMHGPVDSASPAAWRYDLERCALPRVTRVYGLAWDPVPDATQYRVTVGWSDCDGKPDRTVTMKTVTQPKLRTFLELSFPRQYYNIRLDALNDNQVLVGRLEGPDDLAGPVKNRLLLDVDTVSKPVPEKQ